MPGLTGVMTYLWETAIEPSALDTVEFTPYADVRESHSAVIVLVGNRVYKAKKPVDLGFLDFTTTEQRAAACHREVALNRRLAPDIYLGVADVTGPGATTMDHLVVMRRLPEERRLTHLVRSGAVDDGELRRIARLLATFHSRCARSERISAEGSRDALAARWEANIARARAAADGVIDLSRIAAVERRVRNYLRGRESLFARRQESGAIVDGHGDLLADDIFCLDDGPRILDCLDFSDELRWVDRIDDAAFLAMDLERLGSSALADAFIGHYQEFSGDHAPPSLVHHYIAYRAFVRAEVALLRHRQDGAPESAADAVRHLEVAERHLAAGEVRLVLVGGPPGSGKSTVAGGVADRLGLTVLSSDRVRKELAGVSAEHGMAAEYGAGIYTSEWTRRTYRELLRRAEVLLGLGESVVLDATWADRGWRQAAASLAQAASSELSQLRCQLDEDEASRRMAHRRGPSDADAMIGHRLRQAFAPWPEAVVLDTAADTACVTAEATRLVTEGTAAPRSRAGAGLSRAADDAVGGRAPRPAPPGQRLPRRAPARAGGTTATR